MQLYLPAVYQPLLDGVRTLMSHRVGYGWMGDQPGFLGGFARELESQQNSEVFFTAFCERAHTGVLVSAHRSTVFRVLFDKHMPLVRYLESRLCPERGAVQQGAC